MGRLQLRLRIKTIHVEKRRRPTNPRQRVLGCDGTPYFHAWCDGGFVGEDTDRLTAVGIVAHLVENSKSYELAPSVGIDTNAGE